MNKDAFLFHLLYQIDVSLVDSFHLASVLLIILKFIYIHLISIRLVEGGDLSILSIKDVLIEESLVYLFVVSL